MFLFTTKVVYWLSLLMKKNYIFLIIDKAFRLLIGFTVIAYLARNLGAENFGEMNLAITITSLLMNVAIFGLNGTIVKELSNVDIGKKKKEIIISGLILQTVISCIIYLLIFLFYSINNDTQLYLYVLIYSLILFFRVTDVFKYYAEYETKLHLIIKIDLISYLISNGLKFMAVFYGYGVSTILIISVLEVAISSISFALYAFRRKLVIKIKPNLILIMMLVKKGWPLIISSLSVILYMKVDTIMLGYFSWE